MKVQFSAFLALLVFSTVQSKNIVYPNTKVSAYGYSGAIKSVKIIKNVSEQEKKANSLISIGGKKYQEPYETLKFNIEGNIILHQKVDEWGQKMENSSWKYNDQKKTIRHDEELMYTVYYHNDEGKVTRSKVFNRRYNNAQQENKYNYKDGVLISLDCTSGGKSCGKSIVTLVINGEDTIAYSIKGSERTPFGNLHFQNKYRLDGQLISKIKRGDDISNEYDTNGLLLASKGVNMDGRFNEKYNYSFDSKGNWLTKKAIHPTTNEGIDTYRAIVTYYAAEEVKKHNEAKKQAIKMAEEKRAKSIEEQKNIKLQKG